MTIPVVALDFSPGLHGHYLEYVLNKYIFRTPSNEQSIFQSSGACHPINIDTEYQKNKIVYKGHYSAFDLPYPANTKSIVFIKHDPKFDFILLTNIYYRCHPDSAWAKDFDVEEIKKLHKSMMFDSDVPASSMRNNWYNKLMERHFESTDKKHVTDLPVFDFDFGSFFSIEAFLLELRKTANFLNHTFTFDYSLTELWKDFIERNQGYQTWAYGNRLFDDIVSGVDSPIEPNWQVHAYLNYQISTIFNLYDHPQLFGDQDYPTSTKVVSDIILDHINNFDNLYPGE